MNIHEFIQYVIDTYSYCKTTLDLIESIYSYVNNEKLLSGKDKRQMFVKLIDGIDLCDDDIIMQLWND